MTLDDLAYYNVILASASPRRQELLHGLDVRFQVRPIHDVDETYPTDLTGEQIPLYIAEKKADVAAKDLREKDIVITADTVVRIGDVIYGKPKNREEAKCMLQMLSEKTHQVTTAVCVCTYRGRRTFTETTNVQFGYISDEEIEYYLDLYRPYDKAGSYGIQEWIGYMAVERIEGCFYNVMGLPVNRLFKELRLIVM